MKCPRPLDGQKLAFLLDVALSKEARLWKVPLIETYSKQDATINPLQRENVVLWLRDLCSKFGYYPETFFIAVSIVDRLLTSVKAQPKYLRCIAISSLFIAVKINEEDEVTLLVKDLVVKSSSGCTSSEVVRMEKIILDKLQWNLYSATAVDFLNIIHSSDLIYCKSMVEQQVSPSALAWDPNVVYIFDPAASAIERQPRGRPCYSPQRRPKADLLNNAKPLTGRRAGVGNNRAAPAKAKDAEATGVHAMQRCSGEALAAAGSVDGKGVDSCRAGRQQMDIPSPCPSLQPVDGVWAE
ncbi:cyclin-I-like [Rhinoraja longicauda]